MDLRGLRAFCTLARTLNFRSAAEELSLSQPAFSTRIARLEDELGMRLFERSRSGVAILETGRQLLPYAEELLERSDAVRVTALSIAKGQAGQLRIGYTPVSFIGIVPRLLRSFSSMHPDVRLELVEGLSGEIESGVLTGQLDAGFVHPLSVRNDLQFIKIATDPYVAVLPNDHPFAHRQALEIAELAHEEFIMVERSTGPIIYDRLIAMCSASGFSPRIRQEVVNSIAVLGLIGAGHGIGFVSSSMRSLGRDDVVFCAIKGKSPNLPLSLARDAANSSPALARFERFIKKRTRDESVRSIG